jgi:hypothetical protein
VTTAAAFVVVLGFFVLLQALRLPAAAGRAIHDSRGALRLVRDAEIEEIEKERAMRALSMRLFVHFGRLALGTIAAALIPYLLAAGFGALSGLYGVDELDARLWSWPVLVTACVVGFFVLAVGTRRRPVTSSGADSAG